MGYLTAAALIPHLLFSLAAGAWLERVERRRWLMIASDVARAGLLASIPIAYAFDALTFAQLYAVAFLAGTFAVVFDIAYMTLYVAVTKREDYVEANSLLNGSRAFSFVAGPSFGGILVQILSAPAALLADAVSFVGSALFLTRIRAEEPPLEPATGGMRAQVMEGMRFIMGHSILRPSLASVATLNFFNFVFAALFILYATTRAPRALGRARARARRRRDRGPGRGGHSRAPEPASRGRACFRPRHGALPGPAPPRPARRRARRRVVLGMLFTAEFLSAFGVMILDISAGAIITAFTPDRLRSRATGALRFVNYGVRPLGALAGGALGSAFGLRPTLWFAAAAGVLGVLWLVPSPVPKLLELPEEDPA